MGRSLGLPDCLVLLALVTCEHVPTNPAHTCIQRAHSDLKSLRMGSELVPWEKGLATKPAHLSSIPGIHVRVKEK